MAGQKSSREVIGQRGEEVLVWDRGTEGKKAGGMVNRRDRKENGEAER